jgi:hypothetical protein
MLRHSRAQTYIENKKHKEKDRRKTPKKGVLYDTWLDGINKRLLTKKYGTLREHLKSWGM